MFDTAIILHYILMIAAGSVVSAAPVIYAVKNEKNKMAILAFIYCALGAMISIWVSLMLAASFGAAVYVFSMEQEQEEQINIA